MGFLFERDKAWFAERQAMLDERVQVRLGQLSARLGRADWLDDTFSAGDLLMVTVLRRLNGSGLLEKYPNRWVLMHLKDMRKGARTGLYTGHAPLTDDVPLGTGMVDWPVVLRTAAKVGVKHYFIEDESPTAETAIPQSLKYLGTLK